MEARLRRYRHYKSSVGTLLNENYGNTLISKSNIKPVTVSHLNSRGSICYSDESQFQTTSDFVSTCDNIQPSAVNDDNEIKEPPKSSLVKDYLYDELNKLNSKSSRATSAVGSTVEKRESLDSAKSLNSFCYSASRSAGSGKLKWPPYILPVSRQSKTSSVSKTEIYRPFSNTTADFVEGRLKFTPFPTSDKSTPPEIEPPRYCDAYRDIMDLRPMTGCKKSDISTISQDQFDGEKLSLNGTSRPAIAYCDNNCIDKKIKSSDMKTGVNRISSSRSQNSLNDWYSMPSLRPTYTYQSDDMNANRLNVRAPSSQSRTSAVPWWWDDGKQNVIYNGRTPSRTPSPDYNLPQFPSKKWIKHYSPMYIRHFLRAAADDVSQSNRKYFR